MTVILIFAGSVTELINGVSALEWVFYGLVFIALLVMRFTKRHEKRPFKVRFNVKGWQKIILNGCICALFNKIVRNFHDS